MAVLRLDALTRTYSTGQIAVRQVSLTILDGEFLVLVGPSGSGKSTLLRLLAGLESPDAGRIAIDGNDVTDVPPQARDLAMVFQSYALYPHMTVRDNLAYPLRMRGLDAGAIERRVASIAESLDITSILGRDPGQLSGGQRQRVALGRAMVRTPKAFLLDEPLSNLDPGLRTQARAELRRLHRALGATIVHVTHDQEEAMTLGDRIAVMRDGIIEQVASPSEVYFRPGNAFVARFIGAPAMNLMPAELAGMCAPAGAVAGIRPQDVVIGASGAFPAMVDLVEPRGHDAVIHLRLEGRPPLLAVTAGTAPAVGSRVRVTLAADRLHLFTGYDGARLTPTPDRGDR